MTTVYYMETLPRLKGDLFELYLSKVEEERKKKILLMKREESRLQSLTAGSLLYFVLCQETGRPLMDSGPFPVAYEKNGKPCLKGCEDLHFNLSHSGGYVCCAFGDKPVGVDIQKMTDVKEGVAERFFTEKDRKKLDECSGEDKKALFFQMWSIKESFIKLTGAGMAQGLDTFEIDWEKKQILKAGSGKTSAYFMTMDDLPGYGFCVCCREPLEDVRWKNVTEIWNA